MEDEPSFLNLPREVRDEIYKVVIQTPNERPISPSEAGPRLWLEKTGYGGRDIAYELDPRPHVTYTALLLCNKQLRSEVSEMLQTTQRSESLVHRLDCMTAGYMLYPSWILFPGPPQDMRHIEMDFRLFIAGEARHFWGDGGPGRIFHPLFQLLNQFVHHGPQFIYTGTLRHRLQLESLIINIIYMKSIDEQKWTSERRTQQSKSSGKRTHYYQKRIFRTIAMHLQHVAWAGLLTGKVARVGVRSEGVEEIVETGNIQASEHVNSEWDRYGFHWGVDTTVTLEDPKKEVEID